MMSKPKPLAHFLTLAGLSCALMLLAAPSALAQSTRKAPAWESQPNLGPCPAGGWTLCRDGQCVSPYTHHRQALWMDGLSKAPTLPDQIKALQTGSLLLGTLHHCLETTLVDTRLRRDVIHEKIQSQKIKLGEVTLTPTFDREGKVKTLVLGGTLDLTRAQACLDKERQSLAGSMLAPPPHLTHWRWEVSSHYVAACSPQNTNTSPWTPTP